MLAAVFSTLNKKAATAPTVSNPLSAIDVKSEAKRELGFLKNKISQECGHLRTAIPV